MQKILAPIVHKDRYSALVERPILEYMADAIFEPLLDILREAGVRPDASDQRRANATEGTFPALRAALQDGRVWYAAGVFIGTFNAAISRELRDLGARSSPKGFRIAKSDLPISLQNVISDSIEKASALHKTIIATLALMESNIGSAALAAVGLGLELDNPLGELSGGLDRQFRDTVEVKFKIVPPDITPAMRKEMDADLTHNLELSIKDFLSDEIPNIRRMAEKNYMDGGNVEKLASMIEARYGVSKRKAAFLAEQETSLYIAKYREVRYKSVGVNQYIWQTCRDEKVRPDHAILEKSVHSWENPPITNRTTGARNHPGEDYGCRCTACPVFVFQKE